jgi:hypothetical protein
MTLCLPENRLSASFMYCPLPNGIGDSDFFGSRNKTGWGQCS